MHRSIKCEVVGDGAVGKTCFLVKHTIGSFPEDYMPTLFDNYASNIVVNGQVISLSLRDTAGQEEYVRMRVDTYKEAEVFLVCFSLVNRDSYSNVKEKWFPEIRLHCPETPIVLIGTKLDLRDDQVMLMEMGKKKQTPINRMEGLALCSDIGAVNYFEVSALTGVGMEEVFKEAINIVRAAEIPRNHAGFCRLS